MLGNSFLEFETVFGLCAVGFILKWLDAVSVKPQTIDSKKNGVLKNMFCCVRETKRLEFWMMHLRPVAKRNSFLLTARNPK